MIVQELGAVGAFVSSGTTLSITVSQAVPVGRLIVVATAYEVGGGAGAVTVTDSQGNTYTAGPHDWGTNAGIGIFYATTTTALTTSDLIVMSTVNRNNAALIAAVCPQAVGSPYAGAVLPQNTSGTSLDTGASVNHGDLVMGTITATSSATTSNPVGWTTVASNPSLSQNTNLTLGFIVPNASGTVTYAPSITGGNSTTHAEAVVAFPGRSGGLTMLV